MFNYNDEQTKSKNDNKNNKLNKNAICSVVQYGTELSECSNQEDTITNNQLNKISNNDINIQII